MVLFILLFLTAGWGSVDEVLKCDFRFKPDSFQHSFRRIHAEDKWNKTDTFLGAIMMTKKNSWHLERFPVLIEDHLPEICDSVALL